MEKLDSYKQRLIEFDAQDLESFVWNLPIFCDPRDSVSPLSMPFNIVEKIMKTKKN